MASASVSLCGADDWLVNYRLRLAEQAFVSGSWGLQRRSGIRSLPADGAYHMSLGFVRRAL